MQADGCDSDAGASAETREVAEQRWETGEIDLASADALCAAEVARMIPAGSGHADTGGAAWHVTFDARVRGWVSGLSRDVSECLSGCLAGNHAG
jgi:hypothetical protein